MADATMADVFRAIIKIREETPDLAWMLDYPEVAKLLIQRASGRIDDQKFQYDLYRTKFWKTTSDAQRQWRTQVSIDPAKARRQRQQMATRVRQLMGELGVNLPAKGKINAGGGKNGYDTIGATAAARVADLALYNGWNEDQVTNYLLSLASWGDEGRAPTGGIAVAMNQMRRLEEQYGVSSNDRNLFRRAKRMLGGTMTAEAYEEDLRARALARYGENETLKGVLERGGTLEDWFGDYRRMIAQELEMPEAEISLNDKRWQPMLMGGGVGEGKLRPMNADEALRFVRTQDGWGRTRGAQEQAAGFAKTLLESFGRIAA